MKGKGYRRSTGNCYNQIKDGLVFILKSESPVLSLYSVSTYSLLFFISDWK